MYTESTTDNGIHLVTCEEWDDFIEAVRMRRGSTPGTSSEPLYRGHGDPSWLLASLWERFLFERRTPQTAADKTLLGRKLQAFKDLAIGVRGVNALHLQSDLDWWALARHHGLTTPLLDWSKSPYVAAFFACVSYWRLRNPGLAEWGGKESKWGDRFASIWEFDPIEVSGELQIVSVRSEAAYRQKAQQGVFTVLDHGDLFDLESYLSRNKMGQHLTRYDISGRAVPYALADLAAMNVRFSTLFPDLEGAAWGAEWDAQLQLFRAIQNLRLQTVAPPSRRAAASGDH